MKTVIQHLASAINSALYHEPRENAHYQKFVTMAEDLMDELPSGSGIDHGTKLVWEKTRKGKIVLQADFHHMDENGGYDGWTEHEIIVAPDFDGFEIKVTGRNRNQIKEYLADTYHYALSAEVEPFTTA